jgi:hypothetical protein
VRIIRYTKNALCGQNAEFINVRAGGTYSNHKGLKSLQNKSSMTWQASIMYQPARSWANELWRASLLPGRMQSTDWRILTWMNDCVQYSARILPTPTSNSSGDQFFGRIAFASQQPSTCMYARSATFRHWCWVLTKESRWRLASSGMLRRVALVRTDVSEEPSAPIIRVRRIGELGTLAVSSNGRTLWRNTEFLTLYFFTAYVRCYLRLTFLVHRFFSPWWWGR